MYKITLNQHIDFSKFMGFSCCSTICWLLLQHISEFRATWQEPITNRCKQIHFKPSWYSFHLTSTLFAGETLNVPDKMTLWFHYQPRLSAAISCQTTGFTWNCYIIHIQAQTQERKVTAVAFHSNRLQPLHYVIMLFYSVCTVCLSPTKDLLSPSVSVSASLWVRGVRISALPVGPHASLSTRFGEVCQLTATNRCQHL